MSDVETYLRMMSEMRNRLGSSPLKYCCFEEFVLAHGQRFLNYMPRPKWVKRGVVKQCFSNCFDEMLKNPSKLIYCEGYATGVIPVHHAWLLYDGKVIDPTWHDRGIVREHTEYFGIAFQYKYVLKVAAESGYYSVIDNFAQKFPLLRGEHEPEEFKIKF